MKLSSKIFIMPAKITTIKYSPSYITLARSFVLLSLIQLFVKSPITANTYYPFPVLTQSELVTQIREEGQKYDIQEEDLHNVSSIYIQYNYYIKAYEMHYILKCGIILDNNL